MRRADLAPVAEGAVAAVSVVLSPVAKPCTSVVTRGGIVIEANLGRCHLPSLGMDLASFIRKVSTLRPDEFESSFLATVRPISVTTVTAPIVFPINRFGFIALTFIVGLAIYSFYFSVCFKIWGSDLTRGGLPSPAGEDPAGT